VSLRSRLFLGIAGTVLVSLVVTVVAGALLTRRSLEQAGIQALERQVELIVAQRRENPARSTQAVLGQFLATEEQRLAILTPSQAELLLPDAGAARLRAFEVASGSVDVRGTRFLYAAERNGDEAVVLLRPASRAAADWTPFALGLGLAALVGAALAAVVALLLARAVARPVTRVSDASRALAAGERPEPLRVSGPREVAALATSFNDLSVELGRTQEAERAFLLSVSHELKTPLTAIRGHAEALQDGVLEPRGAGTVIDREARRLERLVGDLLDLARLRRRSFSILAEPIDLGDAALAAFERHEAAARTFGVELHAMAEPDALALGDPDRVLQALSNLVENALRSTPEGGTVRILAAPGRLEVVDDGPGIDDADVPRAFERFYLYDRQRAERRVGTGLGLAVVRELADAMGGSAEVRSEPGVGSTFTIVLPFPSGVPAPSEERRPAFVRVARS
jgi:two-component system sensor histidine kinase BaeS